MPSDSRAMMHENMVRLIGIIKNQETVGHHGQQQQIQQAQQHQHQAQSEAEQAQLWAHAQAQAQAQGQMMQMDPQQQPSQLPSQPAAPIPNIEVKILENLIYSRKHTGQFDGKFVSCGEIITIDGEDYVEYRVLTKPTLF
jgi:hypothetical protein